MAVTKQAIEYKIKVESEQAKKGIDGLVSSTERLRDAAGRFATKEQVELYRSLQKTKTELDAQAKAGKDVSEEYGNIENKLSSLGLTAQRTGKDLGAISNGGEDVSLMSESMGDSIRSATIAVAYMTAGLSAFNTSAVSKTITAVSEVSKNFDATSASMRTMSVALKDFSALSSGVTMDTLSSGATRLKISTEKSIPAIRLFANTVGESASKVSTSWQMSMASQLSFFDAVKRTMPAIIDMLKTFGMASMTLGGDIVTAFKNGGMSQVFKELSVNIKTAFSAASVSSAATGIKGAVTGLAKPAKDLGGVFVDVAKDIPNSLQKIKTAFGAVPQMTKDFFNFAKTVSTTHVAPNLIVAAEAASILKGGLIGLGAVLMNSDSGFVKFSGTLLLVAGILLGGFAYAVKVALGYIGDLISSIGGVLLNSMNEMEKKFQKAEVAATNFAFTIAGMSREFGDSAGTLQSWSKIVQELSETTLLAVDDAQKMAAEIMAVGKGLGLTHNQMEDLIRLIPNYVKAGDDAFDVTVSFLQALSGSSRGVIKHAIHLSDASVEHSKLAKSVGFSMDRMSESQKVQARFNALIEQASPIMGRAAIQLGTVAGSQQFLAKSVDLVKQKMGEQNFIVAAANVAFAKLATQMTKLPDAMWTFLGVMQEVLGVTLKVSGVFIAWAFPIAALTGLFIALNAIIATNVTTQFFLSKALTMASIALGGQAIAVTSAATMWAGFATILKGVVVTAFAAVASGLKALALGVWSLTGAILSNPLFWKAAAIVGAVIAVWQALKKIEAQTKIFSEALGTITAPFKSLIDALFSGSGGLSTFGKVLAHFAKGIVSVAVIAVGTLMAGFYSLAGAIAYTLNLLTFGKVEMFSKAVEDANQKIAKLSGVMADSAASILKFEDVASASPMEDFNKGNQDAIDKLKGLQKELISATEKQLIWAQALGQETKALMLAKQLTEERTAIAKDVEEKKTLAREMEQINARIATFPDSLIKDAKSSLARLNIAYQEGLSTAEGIRKAGALKLREALAPLKEKLDALSFLPKTKDTARAMAEIKNVMSATQSAIAEEQKTKIKELSDARIMGELETKIEIAKMRQDELAQIQLNAEKQIAALSIGDKAKSLTTAQQKELTGLILAAKDNQIAEIKEKEISALIEAQSTYAQMMGDRTMIADLEYTKQLEILKKNLKDELIEIEQFEKAKAELQKQRDDKKTEAGLSTANKIVGAIGGGVSGIVNAIGSAFGPIGQFVAGIVNLLNKAPEEMKKFVNELLSALNQLPMIVAKNIPIIIRAIVENLPDSIRSVLGTISILLKEVLFNASFWKDVVNGLIDAVIQGFSDIWSWLFEGADFSKLADNVSSSVGNALKSITGVSGDLFSVESLTEGPVADAADAATKNLLSAGRTIKNWLGMAWEGMKKAGRWLDENIWQPAWEGMKGAFKNVGSFFSNIGTVVWDSIKKAFSGATDFLKGIFSFNWLGDLWSKLFPKPSPSQGTVESWIAKIVPGFDIPFAKFAEGGFVPGTAKRQGNSYENDIIPALLSPGEYVLPRSITSDKDLMDKIMAIIGGQVEATYPGTVGDKVFADLAERFGFSMHAGGLWESTKKLGRNIDPTNKSGAVGQYTAPILAPIVEPIKKVTEAMLPDWLKDLWNSLKRYVSSISFADLISDPAGTLKKAVEGSIGAFLPDVGKAFGFANGGFVPRGTDTVPAMLTPGEFVLNRAAAQQLGEANLQLLNRGILPSANGGNGATTQNVEINLTINTTQGVDAATVKTRVLPVILEELRRASLDGRRVLSPAGVR